MNEKNQIYIYVKTNSHSNINTIANELEIEGFIVLKYINELMEQGYLKMDNPVPLSLGNDCSCYYSWTGKEYDAESFKEVVK